MASRSVNMHSGLIRSTRSAKLSDFPVTTSVIQARDRHRKSHKVAGKAIMVYNRVSSQGKVVCSAVQESATSTVSEPKEAGATGKSEAPMTVKEAPSKPKRPTPAKAPAKPLPELMVEDVIPSLKAILEAQEDISELELSFLDNQLEGSFLKNGIPYCFWVFFPDGVLTGPKGFSLTSYGSDPSTVEPFLIDEKKITGKHVVFWVEKRLAAQGILPVWRE